MSEEKLTGVQKKALKYLEDHSSPPDHKAWRYVSWKRLHRQLKERVKDPTVIKQRTLHWCGPAAVCQTFATDNPLAYVKLVLNLVRYGHASIGHGDHTGELKPDRDIRAYDFRSTKAADADWVPMATLRDCCRPTHKAFTPKLLMKGTPSDRVEWMYKTLGYTSVHDLSTFAEASSLQTAVRRIDYANEFLKKNYRVTLRINAVILKPDGDAKHWVDLLTPIGPHGLAAKSDAPLEFDLFSWGHVFKFRPQGHKRLTLESFANNTFGLVCAKY